MAVFVEHAVVGQDPVCDHESWSHVAALSSDANVLVRERDRPLHCRNRLRQFGVLAREVKRRVVIFKVDPAARLAVARREALRFRRRRKRSGSR